MKKLLPLILLVLIIPQVALAAWWNPFSWKVFSNKEAETQVVNTEALQSSVQYTTFYIKSNGVRIRSCASISCKILGYVGIGNWVKVPENVGTSLDLLPEWLGVDFEGIGFGYINKSLLSAMPISEQRYTQNQQANDDGISKVNLTKIYDWINFIDFEIQKNNNFVDSLYRSNASYSREVISTVENYISNLRIMQNQLRSAITINSSNQALSIITKIQSLRDDFDTDLKVSVDGALRNAERVSDANVKAARNAYNRSMAEQQAANQAKIDATNAYVEKYNAIRKQGSEAGATEAVVNAQLNAAGLIKQATCSFSAVGGMTPGAGSMTCY